MTHLFTATLADSLPPANSVSLESSANLADHRLPQSQVRAANDAISTDQPFFDVCRLPFIGRTLNPWLNMSVHDLSLLRLSDEHMEKLRMEGDPLCDAAIEALFEHNVPVYTMMHLDVGEKQKRDMEAWGFCIPEEEDAASGGPGKEKRTLAEVVLELEQETKDPRLVALISSMLEKPNFGDVGSFEHVIDRAKRLHQRNWLLAGVLLAFRSLFMAYLMPKGMEVLINYGSNLQGPNDFKRLIHTTYWQHLCVQMDDDGLTRDSRSFQATLHVRMMHSAIRRFLFTHGVRQDKTDVGDEESAKVHGPVDSGLLSSGECPMKQSKQRVPWRTAKVGIPINQEDMIGTIFLFSVFLIEGFMQSGIHISMEDAECSYAMWRWIGLRMGILPKNMPKTVFDAIVLGHRIADRSFAVEDRLILYTDSLVAQMCAILPLNRSICSAIIERFSGPDMRQLVRLPPPSAVGAAVVRIHGFLLCAADVVQRRVPGVFPFLMFIKRPVHKLMFHRAVSVAEESRKRLKEKALRSGSAPPATADVPLVRQLIGGVAFACVGFGFRAYSLSRKAS